MDFLKPETVTAPRPTGGAEREVIRSHLLMRTIVGLLGIALPIVLVFGDIFFLSGSVSARGSLSAYYHSGLRDLFVGVLVVSGLALATYKVFRKRNGENRLSTIVGVAAVVVAFFPTRLPDRLDLPETPLQAKLGEDFVGTVHFVAAAVFIIGLAVISYFFGVREAKRESHNNTMSATFWARFHWSMAAIIAAAVAFIAITQLFNFWDRHSLLIGESIAVWAFGASWLAKGLELDVLLGRNPAGAEGS